MTPGLNLKIAAAAPIGGWLVAGFAVAAFALALTEFSGRFDYAFDVADMPVWQMTAGLVCAGAVFVAIMTRLLARSRLCEAATARSALGAVFLAGLAARVILLSSQPVLEDDYYRYLWDGAVVSHGLDPYAYAPTAISNGAAPPTYLKLWDEAGVIAKRINHKDVTTIYPPVAQAAFAAAHTLKPWSLQAWRALLIMFDVATFALLVVALGTLGRSRLWVALYWWNPLVLKELFNSAHFEPLLFPFLLAALLLADRRRPLAASGALALAAGIKLWPVILLPLVLRAFAKQPARAAVGALIFAVIMAFMLAPMLRGGLNETTGLTAYASNWHRNGALFSAVASLFQDLAARLHIGDANSANAAARIVVALCVAVTAIAVAWRPIEGFSDLAKRALAVTAVLVFTMPAAYPWYSLWFLPFLVLAPEPGLVLLSMTMPLYYLFFHYAARDTPEVFSTVIVWLIWLPPLAVIIWQYATRTLRSGHLGEASP